MTRGLLSGIVATSVLVAVAHQRAASAIAWAGDTSPQVTAAAPPLLPVVLPDLSGMHQSVQEQLRDAYASLALTPRQGERSQAYGELGKLLMAAKYPDVAERCFQNAQLLDPNDFRWPYYLGHLFISKGELTRAVDRFEQALSLIHI